MESFKKIVGKKDVTMIMKSRADCIYFLLSHETEKEEKKRKKKVEWREQKDKCEEKGEQVSRAVCSSQENQF